MKGLTDLGLSDTDDQQIYRGDQDMNDAVVAGDGEYKWVGKRTVRPDGVDKVTGGRPTALITTWPVCSTALFSAARMPMRVY